MPRVTALLAIAAAPIVLGGCGGSDDGPSVGATIEVDRTPAGVAVGEGSVWVTTVNGDSVSRIDPTSNEVVAEIPVGDGPEGVVADGGFVWVVNQRDGTLSKIDPGANRVVDTVRLDQPPRQGVIEEALGFPDRSFLEGFDAVSFGGGVVWAAGSQGLARTDPSSLDVTRWSPEALRLGQVVGSPAEPKDVAAGGGGEWLSVPVPTALFGFDPATGASKRYQGGGDAVWSLDATDGQLVRSALGEGELEAYDEIDVGEEPDDVAVGEGAVWVPLSDGTLIEVDPASGDIASRPRLLEDGGVEDGLSLRVAVGEGAVWVASRTGDRVFRVDPSS